MSEEPKRARPTIFAAKNNHAASCGIPPSVDAAVPGKYYGYFENEGKEQFIFEYDHTSKKGTLWLGDNQWDHPVTISDPEKPSVNLGKAEWLWLQACWMAATLLEKYKEK